VRRLLCRLRLHKWAYFVDGSIGRSCDRCADTQYDLPTVIGPRTNKDKEWFA
jgi:hypothetical protein